MDSVFFIHAYIIGEVSINLSYIRTGGYLHALPNTLQLMCSVVCFFLCFLWCYVDLVVYQTGLAILMWVKINDERYLCMHSEGLKG